MAWTFPDHDKQVKHTRINNSNNSGRNIPASMQGKCTKCGKNSTRMDKSAQSLGKTCKACGQPGHFACMPFHKGA